MIGCAFQILDLWIDGYGHLSQFGLTVKSVTLWILRKHTYRKKGTTTMKCASSAEADVSDQAVALFIAVISQIVRTCHLLVWWLLRTATLAFATKPFVIQAVSYQWASPSQQQTFVLSKPFSGKSTSSDGEQERVGCLPENTVPIQDCDSACRKMADLFPLSVTAGCSRLLHSDNLAIRKTASTCEINHFPD